MFNRRNSRTNLSREIAQLRSDFNDVYDRVSNMRSPLASQQSTWSRMMPWLDQGLSYAMPSRMRQASDMASSMASRGAGELSDQAEQAMRSAVSAMRRRPIPAGLALLAIGVAIGMATHKAASN